MSMTRDEQIRRILDEWRTVSETDREQVIMCLAHATNPDSPAQGTWQALLTQAIANIISKRGDMT